VRRLRTSLPPHLICPPSRLRCRAASEVGCSSCSDVRPLCVGMLLERADGVVAARGQGHEAERAVEQHAPSRQSQVISILMESRMHSESQQRADWGATTATTHFTTRDDALRLPRGLFLLLHRGHRDAD
jgi:hypothetical protein